MKTKKQIWFKLLSYTYQAKDDVFKIMAMLVTGYYLACLVAFFCFGGQDCREETFVLLLVFLMSMTALSMLLFRKTRTSVLFYTILLPLCVLVVSFTRPAIDFSTSILLIAILSLLVTGHPVRRVIKFLLHAAIYVFIKIRYGFVPVDNFHEHLSLFNIILLPFGCLFFIVVFSRINRAFRFYQEQHQLKRQHLSDANKTLKNLLSSENRQKQKLKRSVAFKQQLISILSHDIRTPLFAYRMLIDGYEKKYYDEKDLVKEFVNSKEELIKIDEMTCDLAKWAKADGRSGQREGMSVEQLLGSLESVKMVYTKSLKNKNLTAIISTDIQPTGLLCIGRRQFETIVRNLLSNAIKFSQEGSSVYITIERAEENGSFALLTVKDLGVGMSARKLKELNKNSLISGKGTANEEGLGIGLSLVFDILNRNDLKYIIESEEGKGTSFKIWIHLKHTKKDRPVEGSSDAHVPAAP